MSVNLKQNRRAVGTFNSSFNQTNSLFHKKPNVSSIANGYFATLINFCTFVSVLKSFCLIVLFKKIIKTHF